MEKKKCKEKSHALKIKLLVQAPVVNIRAGPEE